MSLLQSFRAGAINPKTCAARTYPLVDGRAVAEALDRDGVGFAIGLQPDGRHVYVIAEQPLWFRDQARPADSAELTMQQAVNMANSLHATGARFGGGWNTLQRDDWRAILPAATVDAALAASTLAGVEKFLQALAPELRATPIYCVNSAALPGSSCPLTEGGGCAACTCSSFIHSLRAYLLPWRGPGVVLVFNMAALAEQATRKYPSMPLEQTLSVETDRVAVHELAHTVGQGTPPYYAGAAPPQLPDEIMPAGVAAAMTNSPAPQSHQRAPWSSHGTDFLRAALHLAHRARMAPGHVIPSHSYQLSPASDYAEALGDEVQRLEYEPFEAVKATIPPVAFSDLFAADTLAWFSREVARIEAE